MKKIILVLLLSYFVFCSFAQESLKSLEEEYYDYLSLIGFVERPALGYRSFSDSVWNITEESNHPWMSNNLGSYFTFLDLNREYNNFYLNGVSDSIKLRVYGPEWYNSYNRVQPFGQNDGGLWQGVGYNTSLTTGFIFDAFGVNIAFKPQLSFSQNLEYRRLIGYGNPYNFYYFPVEKKDLYIDLVQRYGDKPFVNFDWGDSEVRYSFYNFTIGFGTGNPWLGPAYLNPMLGSNNAGGYPKLDLGFRRTKIVLPWNDLYFGDIEARAFVGMLSESDYFDEDDTNNKRMINALSVSLSPAFIPGLTIGGNRVILTGWDVHNLKYFIRLFNASHANDVTGPGEDQKVSVYFDWLFPSVGFEVYGEMGIDDFSYQKIAEPFHTAIFSAGLKKDIPLWEQARDSNIRSELIFEIGNYEISRDYFNQGWPYAGYYTHNQIKQGYTNNGQLLGSGSGYFGNSQYLAYIVYYPKGMTKIIFHRHCPNSNYIYNVPNLGIQFTNDYQAYVTNLDFGVETSYFVTRSLILTGGITYNRILNALYIREETIKDNFHFNLSVKYNI